MYCRQRKPSDYPPFKVAPQVRLNHVQIREIRTAYWRYKYTNHYTFSWKYGGEEDWEFVQNVGAINHHLVCHRYKPY